MPNFLIGMSKLVVFVLAWPHEMLHVLALRLIGKQPERVGATFVLVPEGLSLDEIIFVNALPVLVTGTLFALGFLVPRVVWDNPIFIVLHGLMLAYTGGSAGDIGTILGAIFLKITEKSKQ